MREMTYPRKWRWPNGQKMAMSVGLAFEAFDHHSQFSTHTSAAGRTKVNHFSLSYADYGWKAGVWRLLEVFDRYGLKANMSTSGLAAERHPECRAAVARPGTSSTATAGSTTRSRSDDDEEAERAEIRRCTKAITDATGVRRSAGPGRASPARRTRSSILKAEGYLWNGDDASDDLPFLRDTDKGPMVIMPRTNTPQNDLTMWLAPRNPPSILWEGFRDTFDTLYAEGEAGAPKWMEITLHCHIAGRPTLQPVMRQCFDYAKQHDDIWFARRRDIAEWCLKHEGVG